MTKRTVKCPHEADISKCGLCFPEFTGEPMSDVEQISGQPAHERLMQAVHREANFYLSQPKNHGNATPTPIQVAVVLHALADHTAIMSMLNHRHDETSPWPHATSVGRWFHDVGHDLEGVQPTHPVDSKTPEIEGIRSVDKLLVDIQNIEIDGVFLKNAVSPIWILRTVSVAQAHLQAAEERGRNAGWDAAMDKCNRAKPVKFEVDGKALKELGLFTKEELQAAVREARKEQVFRMYRQTKLLNANQRKEWVDSEIARISANQGADHEK